MTGCKELRRGDVVNDSGGRCHVIVHIYKTAIATIIVVYDRVQLLLQQRASSRL